MKKYKVSFWFNGNEGKADREVHVNTDTSIKQEIISLASKQLYKRPRTYEATVEEVTANTRYVIRIKQSKEMHPDAWYYGRDGQLFVVYEESGRYITCQHINFTNAIGVIESRFFEVVTTFNV